MRSGRFIGSLVFHPRRTLYEYLGIRMNIRLGAVAVIAGFLLGWFLLPRFLGERSYETSFGPLGVARASREDFLIKGERLTILSGAIHYFRVVPDYWYDRLIKLKAMGLNTVETLVQLANHTTAQFTVSIVTFHGTCTNHFPESMTLVAY